jgi:hypothetical protein
MVDAVQPVSFSAVDIQQFLALAVSQILEQATDIALLNLEMSTGGNPEGVGENVDVVA